MRVVSSAEVPAEARWGWAEPHWGTERGNEVRGKEMGQSPTRSQGARSPCRRYLSALTGGLWSRMTATAEPLAYSAMPSAPRVPAVSLLCPRCPRAGPARSPPPPRGWPGPGLPLLRLKTLSTAILAQKGCSLMFDLCSFQA